MRAERPRPASGLRQQSGRWTRTSANRAGAPPARPTTLALLAAFQTAATSRSEMDRIQMDRHRPKRQILGLLASFGGNSLSA
jgi:hypothetical protein